MTIPLISNRQFRVPRINSIYIGPVETGSASETCGEELCGSKVRATYTPAEANHRSTDPSFHDYLFRRASLYRHRPTEEQSQHAEPQLSETIGEGRDCTRDRWKTISKSTSHDAGSCKAGERW